MGTSFREGGAGGSQRPENRRAKRAMQRRAARKDVKSGGERQADTRGSSRILGEGV